MIQLNVLFFLFCSKYFIKSTPNPGSCLHRLAAVTKKFLSKEMFALQTCQESSSFTPSSDGTKKEKKFYGASTFFPLRRELCDPGRCLQGVRGPAKFPYLFCCGCISKIGKGLRLYSEMERKEKRRSFLFHPRPVSHIHRVTKLTKHSKPIKHSERSHCLCASMCASVCVLTCRSQHWVSPLCLSTLAQPNTLKHAASP